MSLTHTFPDDRYTYMRERLSEAIAKAIAKTTSKQLFSGDFPEYSSTEWEKTT